MSTSTTNYNLYKPAAGESGCADELNTNLDTIDTALKNLSDGKAAENHNHDQRYYTEAEINQFLALKSDDGHGHPISQISGLSSLFGSLVGKVPSTPAIGNLSSVYHAVRIDNGFSDPLINNNVLEWHSTLKWSNPANPGTPIIQEPLSGLTPVLSAVKPPADSSVWDASGKAVLKVTSYAINPFGATQSSVSAEATAEVTAFVQVSDKGIAESIVNDTAMLQRLVSKIAEYPALANSLRTALNSTQ